jgi:exosome complex component RRP43
MAPSLAPKTFPSAVFAALDPAAYLHAHLTQSPPTRPDARPPRAARQAAVSAAPLSHSHGSALARCGGTAAATGVRGEILLASPSDAAAEQRRRQGDDDEQRRLSLLVPNVEFATGCSPQWLPGSGAPPARAQQVAWRVRELLLALRVVEPAQLRITRRRRRVDAAEDDEDEDMDKSDEEKEEVVAYWTLYIDTYVLSLDGPALDTVWLSVLAALRATRLPRAYWDGDLQTVLCDPDPSAARPLRVDGAPIAATCRVFDPARHKGLVAGKEERPTWVLADPSQLEEDLCDEEVLVVVDCADVKARGARIRWIEKAGGGAVQGKEMRDVVRLAVERWRAWSAAVDEAVGR